MDKNNDSMNEAEFLERVYLVLQALRQGDLSPRIRPWDDPRCDRVGRMLNETMAHLAKLVSEVNRVQYEVGVMGQLGPQAEVGDAEGDWKKLAGHVNRTAANLTAQIRNFGSVVRSIEQGDFGQRADVTCHGEIRQLRDALNRVIAKLDEPRQEIFRRESARGELIFPSGE